MDSFKKMKSEVEKDLQTSKEIQEKVDMHSNKVEDMFMEIEEKYGSIEQVKEKQKNIEDSFKDIRKRFDDVQIKVEDTPDKKELMDLKEEVNDNLEAANEILPVIETAFDELASEQGANPQEKFRDLGRKLEEADEIFEKLDNVTGAIKDLTKEKVLIDELQEDLKRVNENMQQLESRVDNSADTEELKSLKKTFTELL